MNLALPAILQLSRDIERIGRLALGGLWASYRLMDCRLDRLISHSDAVPLSLLIKGSADLAK